MPEKTAPAFGPQAEKRLGKLDREGTTINLKDATQCVLIRIEGGYITEYWATSLGNILYSPKKLLRVKTDASHAMSPVGPNEDVQHGIPRWLKYSIAESLSGTCTIEAFDTHRRVEVQRSFELLDRGLGITTTIKNHNETALNTSLGEHLYFAVPEDAISSLEFEDRKQISVLLPDGTPVSGSFTELSDTILDGVPLVYNDFTGFQRILMPNGNELKLNAIAYIGDRQIDTPVTLLIWHRKGTDSLCFEPVIGVSVKEGSVDFRNQELRIEPGESASLRVEIFH